MGHRAASGAYGRTVAAVLAWAVGAVLSVVVGTTALSLIGSGLADRSRPPLAAQVLAGNSPSPSVDAHSSPFAPAQAVQRTFTSEIGSVTARCTGEEAYLISWSPAPGYRAEDVHRGPAFLVRLEFQSSSVEYAVSVRCFDGVPQASTNRERHR